MPKQVPRRRANAPGPARKTRPSMHQHRTDEHHTSGDAPTRHRVRGLGICDVLEVELEPGQIDGLIAEIDDLCIALEQSISELVSRNSQEASPGQGDNEETVRRHLHQIAVARAIRGQLVTGDPGRRTVFGPARSLTELIDGATAQPEPQGPEL